jgi:cytidylate kinase
MTSSAEALSEAHLRALQQRLVKDLRAHSLYISLSGLDGSGKSTLAREICQAVTAAGVRCQIVHVFAWYKTLTVVPYRMIAGRSRGQVLIFDRSIYDNLVVFFARSLAPLWLARLATGLVRFLYPRFDHRFFLYAPFEVIAERRPEISCRHYEVMLERYQTVLAVADYRPLAATPALFDEVLSLLLGPDEQIDPLEDTGSENNNANIRIS